MAANLSRHSSFRITFLLITVFGGLTALAVGLVLAISAYSSLTGTRSLMRDQALMFVSSFEHSIKQHLAPAENMIRHIKTLVESEQLDLDDREALRLTLMGTLAAAPQLAGIIIWRLDLQGLKASQNKDGAVIFSHIDNSKDPGFRKLFEQQKNRTDISWGRPVRAEGQTYLYMIAPLRLNNRFLGFATASISSVELSSFLDRLKIEQNATPFVLYGDQKVLAHPFLLTQKARQLFRPETPFLTLAQTNDPVLNRLSAARRLNPPSDSFAVHEVGHGSASYLVISRLSYTYGTPPWRIGVYGPRRAWTSEMTKLRHSFVIGLLLLVVAVIMAIFLAKRIAAPIKAFAGSATQIGHMDLGRIPPLKPSRIKELNDQALAFNQMLAGLKQFETYIPKRLVERLISEGGENAAHSRSADLTIMFTDIVGFTSLSEKLPADDTAEMLNIHFELINQCIEATGGTLDKYIGDSAMAFWGAPEQLKDHARRAATTALMIAGQLESAPSDKRWPDLRIKIALHSGPTIVGNIGARTRTNYTVIGDTVNTCSRIESLTGQFDDGRRAIILLSNETARLIGEGFDMKPVGEFELRGRDQPIRLWQLTGPPQQL